MICLAASRFKGLGHNAMVEDRPWFGIGFFESDKPDLAVRFDDR